MKKLEKIRKREGKEKNREKEREKEEEEKMREKDAQGQLLPICIQFSQRKTKYMGRNAQNIKNLVDIQ